MVVVCVEGVDVNGRTGWAARGVELLVVEEEGFVAEGWVTT